MKIRASFPICLSLIITLWFAMEAYAGKDRSWAEWFVTSAALILGCHLLVAVVFSPLVAGVFSDRRSRLSKQWLYGVMANGLRQSVTSLLLLVLLGGCLFVAFLRAGAPYRLIRHIHSADGKYACEDAGKRTKVVHLWSETTFS